MRIEQPAGRRGSLKWIQRAVNERWPELESGILAAVGGDRPLQWLSPLESDGFAEYRDGAFLERLGCGHLKADLADFWPARGPQWDALARTDGDVILVEAKAHVAEMCSPGTAAGPASRARILTSLDAVADRLGANANRAAWTDHFYQFANRLAHLDFLRQRGVSAWLVLANFVGDREMKGPATAEAWEAAYQVAEHVMGLPRRHKLSPWIVHVCPDVSARRTGELTIPPTTEIERQ
jgi:hypothetical protein